MDLSGRKSQDPLGSCGAGCLDAAGLRQGISHDHANCRYSSQCSVGYKDNMKKTEIGHEMGTSTVHLGKCSHGIFQRLFLSLLTCPISPLIRTYPEEVCLRSTG